MINKKRKILILLTVTTLLGLSSCDKRDYSNVQKDDKPVVQGEKEVSSKKEKKDKVKKPLFDVDELVLFDLKKSEFKDRDKGYFLLPTYANDDEVLTFLNQNKIQVKSIEDFIKDLDENIYYSYKIDNDDNLLNKNDEVLVNYYFSDKFINKYNIPGNNRYSYSFKYDGKTNYVYNFKSFDFFDNFENRLRFEEEKETGRIYVFDKENLFYADKEDVNGFMITYIQDSLLLNDHMRVKAHLRNETENLIVTSYHRNNTDIFTKDMKIIDFDTPQEATIVIDSHEVFQRNEK